MARRGAAQYRHRLVTESADLALAALLGGWHIASDPNKYRSHASVRAAPCPPASSIPDLVLSGRRRRAGPAIGVPGVRAVLVGEMRVNGRTVRRADSRTVNTT